MPDPNPEQVGVFVGRFCPIHVGHEQVIRFMLDTCGAENSTIIVGSQNTPMSMRHFFDYEERRDLIRTVFPEATIVGLPDFGSDKMWLSALDDLLNAIHGRDSLERIKYFGGSREDVNFFESTGRNVHILNRFDGTTPKTSASEVRDRLLEGQLEGAGLVNEQIEAFVIELFKSKWELFKRR